MNDNQEDVCLAGLGDCDYLAGADQVCGNSATHRLCDLLNRLRPLQARLDLSWCGAFVAQLFIDNPWLQACKLDLWAESVYDDEGGTFMSHYARFTEPSSVPGVSLPEDVCHDDGAFDADAAAELLNQEAEDCEVELCEPFIGHGREHSCVLALDRAALAPLLAAGAVSGLAVAQLLWPDHEALRSAARSTTAAPAPAADAQAMA